MSRQYRTSRLQITFNLWLAAFAYFGIIAWMLNQGGAKLGLFEVIVSATIYVSTFIFLAWVTCKLIGNIFWSGSEAYQRFKELGGDNFFDWLPPPFNNDPFVVRIGGMPEPETEFDPPTSWSYQCPECGARNPDWESICWNCGI